MMIDSVRSSFLKLFILLTITCVSNFADAAFFPISFTSCLQGSGEPSCPESKMAAEVLKTLAANEQLVGISVRDDKPDELFAIVVSNDAQQNLSNVIFRKFKKENDKVVRDSVEKSGDIDTLNKMGTKIHEETGGPFFYRVTRTVIHLRAMAKEETSVSAKNYNPLEFDEDEYSDALQTGKGAARIGDLDSKNGGRLWLSYATDARGEDNIWANGVEIYVLPEIRKDPATGVETRRWILASDSEGKKKFDTIPLVVKKNGDELNGVETKPFEAKIAEILDGTKSRGGLGTTQTSSDVKNDSKEAAKDIYFEYTKNEQRDDSQAWSGI